MNRTPLPLVILLILLSAWGCGTDGAGTDDGTQQAETPHDAVSEGDLVTLARDHVVEAGIETAPVVNQELILPIGVPGRIVPSESGQAVAGATVTGRLTQLYAAEGQSVARGQPLAVIESPQVGSLQGELLHAQATTERSELELRRQEQLFAEGLSAERLLELAREGYRAAQADEVALVSQLTTLGALAAGGPDGVTGIVTVRAPIAGVVLRRIASLGDFVDQSEDLYEIIAPGSVYADAEVPPEQAAFLRPGMGAVIIAPGDMRFGGRIASLAPSVEAVTRTTRIRISIEQATPALRPETFVTVQFAGEVGRRALVVPPSAIERDGGTTFVYRVRLIEPGGERAGAATPTAIEDGTTYERVAVELGDAVGDAVEVRNGLSAGDEIVVKGVFYLRSTRQRGMLAEDDH